MKAQTVRLVDVALIGPWMIYVGMKREKLTDFERIVMVTIGIGTMVYNGSNYLKALKHGEG